MNQLDLILVFFFLLSSTIQFKLEEDKYYFQLSTSEKMNEPSLYTIYKLNSENLIINATEGENPKIISTIKTSTTPIKELSSVIKFQDKFLIKTCFGPDKILEIIDENGQIYTPQNDYFTKVKNLENIKYCYSTAVMHPVTIKDFLIYTYWTESATINGNEAYSHKFILFHTVEKTFSEVFDLDSQKKNFYAQSCTTLGNLYIYCTIASSLTLSKKYDFSIDSSYSFAKTKEIKMVSILARFSNSIYHQPIGIFKQTYTKTGKTAHYFLTEYHDKDANKTRLMTSVYINYYLMSFILRFEGLGIYYGINIEDFYVDPNLFNHLLPNNEELLIIYISKGANGKNNLLLNRYDYNQSLQVQTKFDIYTLSNYLRDDICANPKYMQSMFITSYISYDENDKQIIQSSPEGTYYKFQKDIGTIIACAEEDGSVSYDIKKIPLPQCLNVLDQLNGKSGSLLLSPEQETIILDIKNNPNLKSLRNVEIEFLDSNIYNTIFTVEYTKDDIKQPAITKSQTVSNIDSIEFIPTSNYKKGKTYQIPYRIKQTGFSGISSTCHLTSDICYFEINYKIETGIENESIQIEEDCTVKYCKECENNQCIECDDDIIGIKLNKKKNQCVCNEDNGFDKEPNTNLSMCLCKDDYSFYQDISTCLPDFILKSGDYCITGQDEKSLIYIYDKVPIGMTKYYKDGLPYCKTTQVEECIAETWFQMGKYQFNYAKIDKCVYIIFNDSIIMYSNMSECEYKYYDYKNCLNLDINNEEEYYAAIKNAYEYVPDDNSTSLNITIDDNVKFYILNDYTKKKISSVTLSNSCIKKVQEENNLQSLLIFVANIKKPNIRSTQVEYSFYNPVPEYMYKELDMSICYAQEKQSEINVTDLTEEEEEEENEWERRRRLQLPSEEKKYEDNKYDIEMDEVIVDVQIDWTEENMKIIQELYVDRDINIFDSQDEFYNDVCNKFTSPEKTDVYLQDRREKYFITGAICESRCEQIGYDQETSRAVCKCKIKESPNNFENVTFSSNNLEDHFEKKYKLPNLKVMKCFLKINFLKNGGQIFALLLIIAFIILNCCRYYHIIDLNEEKNKSNNNIESCNQNIQDSPEEENKFKSYKKCRKERCVWEVPIEELIDKIHTIEEEEEKKEKEINKEKEKEEGKDEDPDEEEGLGFRVPKEGTNIKRYENRIKNIKKVKSEKKQGMIERLSNSYNSNSEETGGNSAFNLNGKGGKNEGKNNIIDQTNPDTTLNISNQNNNTNNDNNSNINNDDIIGYKKINKLKESLKKNETNPSNDTQSVNPHNNEIDPYSKDPKEEEEKKSETESNNNQLFNSSQNDYRQFNVPKEQSEDNNKPPEENNDNDNKLIKIKKKKKKKDKPNPPAKGDSNSDNNKVQPPGNQSDREDLNRKKRKEKGENDNKDCDELFKKYVYIVKRDTQNSADLNDFIYTEENNGNAQGITFMNIFLSKYISHSTLFFILPWIICTKYDKDAYYIKLSVLLLYIAFYMAFNIFTEFKLTTLHLYIQKWMYENYSFIDIFINMFLPFMILYIPIAWLKKSLSITVFYIQEEKIIDSYKKSLEYFSAHHKMYKRILKVYLKEEESKIKKFRNNMYTNNKLIILYGSVLLLFNWYLATTFCSIYKNSFGCIVVNVLISMALTIGFSLLLHLVSAILKYFKLFSGGFCFLISECFNCKKIVDFTFLFICKISYCLCCECYKEEFYSSRNDIDTRAKIVDYMQKYSNNNHNENQEIRSSNPNIVNNQNDPTTTDYIINNIKQYID